MNARTAISGSLIVGILGLIFGVSGPLHGSFSGCTPKRCFEIPDWNAPPDVPNLKYSPGWAALKLPASALAMFAFGMAWYIAAGLQKQIEAERRHQALTDEKELIYAAAELEAHQAVAKLQAAEAVYPQLAPYVDAQAKLIEAAHQAELDAEQAAVVVAEEPEKPTSTDTSKPREVGAKHLKVLLGRDREKVEHYWEPSQQTNGFFAVFGASGSGKTETLKAIAAEVHHAGFPCLVLDFHGDVVLRGAKVYTLSHAVGSTHGINPMELDSTDPEDGGVYAQVNILLEMLAACVNIGHRQWRVIKDCLFDVYERAGISDRDPSTWNRKAPTFKAVLATLDLWAMEREVFSKEQRSILESARDAVAKVFEHPVFAKNQQVSIQELLNHSHRLDLSKLEQDEIRYVIADTVLRKVVRALRVQGPIPVAPKDDSERYRLFSFVDEVKILSMGKDKDDPKAILNKITTEYRKFGLGMGIGAQRVKHLSEEALGQIAVRIVLKPFDKKEAEQNAGDINLTAEELLALAGKGDGYLKMGSQGAPIRIQITPLTKRNLSAPKPEEKAEVEPEPQPEPAIVEQPKDFLAQVRDHIARSWANSDALPPHIPTSEVLPEVTSEVPRRDEVLQPPVEVPEVRNTNTSSDSEVLPASERKEALKRLCDLLKDSPRSDEVREFLTISRTHPDKGVWYGIKILGFGVTAASKNVFNCGSGGAAFKKAANWYRQLEEKFGVIKE